MKLETLINTIMEGVSKLPINGGEGARIMGGMI